MAGRWSRPYFHNVRCRKLVIGRTLISNIGVQNDGVTLCLPFTFSNLDVKNFLGVTVVEW